jgi:hypothetical protein
MYDREERVVEMKEQVNALLAELDRQPHYQSVLEDDELISTGDAL